MTDLTAMQKVRLTLTGDPQGEPHFQHEGPKIVRWISSGRDPSAYVTFHRRGTIIEARCPTCSALIGQLPADYGESIAHQLAAIQRSDHQHIRARLTKKEVRPS